MNNVLTVILVLCTNLSIGFTNLIDNKSEVVLTDDWDKIDSIFRSIVTEPVGQRYCDFKYKMELEPDVDVFDPKFEKILGKVTKQQALKLVTYYLKFCGVDNQKSEKPINKNQIDKFLTDNLYSIQLDYKIENNKTTDISCLIFDGKKFLFFSMGLH
jgi:hypothetical protein